MRQSMQASNAFYKFLWKNNITFIKTNVNKKMLSTEAVIQRRRK